MCESIERTIVVPRFGLNWICVCVACSYCVDISLWEECGISPTTQLIVQGTIYILFEQAQMGLGINEDGQ